MPLRLWHRELTVGSPSRSKRPESTPIWNSIVERIVETHFAMDSAATHSNFGGVALGARTEISTVAVCAFACANPQPEIRIIEGPRSH